MLEEVLARVISKTLRFLDGRVPCGDEVQGTYGQALGSVLLGEEEDVDCVRRVDVTTEDFSAVLLQFQDPEPVSQLQPVCQKEEQVSSSLSISLE